MLMKRIIFFTFAIACIFFSACVFVKPTVHLYNVKNYYEVYEDKKVAFDFFKKSLLKRFIKVKEFRLKSISSMVNQLSAIDSYKGDSIIFLEDSFAPLLMKSSNITFDRDRFKLVTLNIPADEIFYSSNIRTYNAFVSPEVIAKKIFEIFKRHSTDKKFFSDCAIVINTDFFFPNSIVSVVERKGLKVELFFINEPDKKFEEWIYSKKRKAIAFFGYKGNELLMSLKKTALKDTILIELLTEYHKVAEIVDYSIDFNWVKIFDSIVKSDSFNRFLYDRLDFGEKNIYTEKLNSISFLKEERYKIKKR